MTTLNFGYGYLINTYLAMERSGKIRFLNYNDWEFHKSLGIINIWWNEMKRLQKYTMLMIPDYFSYLFDIYYCLGCYYCISGGLIRSERQEQSEQENVALSSLFSMKIGSVATKLANVLCAISSNVLGD